MVRKAGILGILMFLFWGHSFAAVKVISERHRTEWNWVEYRLHLVNGSENSLINPEVHYFSQNSWREFCENRTDFVCEKVRCGIVPADSILTATVDYVSFPFSSAVSAVSNSEFTTFKIRISGIVPPNDSIQIHFRIHRKDWAGWSDEKSFSHQKDAGIFEPNFFISVYSMGGQLLWGVDPVNGKWTADEIWWDFRGKRFLVKKFDGEEEPVSGRFWLLKENPLSKKERRLLSEMGVERLSAGPYQGLNLILFKARNSVSKITLNKIVAGFYNAFDADDTTAVKLNLSAEDFGKDSLKLQVGCWRDVLMSECRNLVEICGGKDAWIDRTVVLSEFPVNRLECLERNQEVYRLDMIYEGNPTNNFGREAVRISGLQSDSVWKAELKKSKPSQEWLQNASYTGEGIIAGVYDHSIDFSHPDFQEDSAGVMESRIFDTDEALLGSRSSLEYESDHGTHVAGTLGGNGAVSEGYRYRGVAPKVHFFSGGMSFYSQIGHVVNHSHTYLEKDAARNYYGFRNQNVDGWIFNDWKDASAYGDTLSKLVVVAAGNNGSIAGRPRSGYGDQIGYHSILVDAKNPVTVGNYASITGIRNTNSSIGPTWDGRIKPDVMAPGSTAQYSFDTSNPFTVYIDYAKFYRKNSQEPYFVLDFSHFVQPSAEKYVSTLEVVQDKEASNGLALKYSDFRPDVGESYINWKLSDFGLGPVKIDSGDVVEFRVRTDAKNLARPYLSGNVYFCPNENNFYDKRDSAYTYQYVGGQWPLAKEYSLTKFIWAKDSMTTRFFRFDFIYDHGILSSVPCTEISETNCYVEESGTSMSAPFVSGIGALMYQRFAQKTRKSLTQESMRNSTAKAILIHTAEDMIDTVGFARDLAKDIFYAENDGQNHLVKFGKGPDFATGWGKVNGEKALNVLEDFDEKRRTFNRFREFGIANGKEARWNMAVPAGKENLRVTLAWDDCAGIDGLYTSINFSTPKLCNDLDLYLISPSGKFYFPWRINPLPIDKIDFNGNPISWSLDTFGLERIKETDMPKAERYCGKNDELLNECFDHLNNVEVVDVDNPEEGIWQVVVRGTTIREGNSGSDLQVASIVSDFTLMESSCQIVHPYKVQDHLECEYNLGDNLEAFITFDGKTFVGIGDTITLSDGSGKVLGKYTGNSLAGKRIRTKSSKIKVELESDNDSFQGYGFEIRRIEKTPFSMVPLFLPAIQSRRK